MARDDIRRSLAQVPLQKAFASEAVTVEAVTERLFVLADEILRESGPGAGEAQLISIRCMRPVLFKAVVRHDAGVMTDKERIWAERVRERKASGKTLQEFAKGQSYKGLTLRWWGSELRRRGLLDRMSERGRRPRGPAKTPSVRMVRVVRRPAPEPAGWSIAVEIGGARIVVQQGFDAGVLSNVVRVLKEAR